MGYEDARLVLVQEYGAATLVSLAWDKQLMTAWVGHACYGHYSVVASIPRFDLDQHKERIKHEYGAGLNGGGPIWDYVIPYLHKHPEFIVKN